MMLILGQVVGNVKLIAMAKGWGDGYQKAKWAWYEIQEFEDGCSEDWSDSEIMLMECCFDWNFADFCKLQKLSDNKVADMGIGGVGRFISEYDSFEWADLYEWGEKSEI